ncbi:MAG: hypothetical protein ABL927_14320 [Bdellovibrionales bacterium]
MKRNKKIKVKIDNLKLSKQISRLLFKDVPMKEKVMKDKTQYTRKKKHIDPLD